MVWAGSRFGPVEAEDLFREVSSRSTPSAVAALYDRVLAAWGLRLSPFAAGAVSPTDRFIVAGPAAVASLATAFAEGRGLDWADQVLVVATLPSHRQVAALALSILDVMKRVEIPSAMTAAALNAKSVGARRKAIVSPDADPRDADIVRSLGEPA